jgi:hypothetical protein
MSWAQNIPSDGIRSPNGASRATPGTCVYQGGPASETEFRIYSHEMGLKNLYSI